MLWLLSSLAAAAPCGPTLPDSPASLSLRGHDYALIGACGGLPVYRTAVTDSTFLDRGEAPFPLVLVTEESRDPTSAEDGWPAPTGNLYLSAPHPGSAEEAKQRLSTAVTAWLQVEAPTLPLTEGWDGLYGAHRGPGGQFLTGLVVETREEGAAMGLDVHLNATAAQYEALGAQADHRSLSAHLSRPFDVDDALWSLLPRLLAVEPPGAAEAPTTPTATAELAAPVPPETAPQPQ